MKKILKQDYEKNVSIDSDNKLQMNSEDVASSLIYCLRLASRRGSYVDMIRYMEKGFLPYLQFLIKKRQECDIMDDDVNSINVDFICGSTVSQFSIFSILS